MDKVEVVDRANLIGALTDNEQLFEKLKETRHELQS